MRILYSIEKPSYMPYIPDRLRERQREKGWYGEIKLNEHRCFIVVDAKGGITIRGYKAPNSPLRIASKAIADLKDMDLPVSTVFDGGYVRLKDLGETRLWIFDVLTVGGKNLDISCDDRCKYRDELITPTSLIWMPLRTDNWLNEFGKMLDGPTALMRKNAIRCGIPIAKFDALVEGLVVKRRDSKHSYPKSVKIISASYFKLLRARKLSGIAD